MVPSAGAAVCGALTCVLLPFTLVSGAPSVAVSRCSSDIFVCYLSLRYVTGQGSRVRSLTVDALQSLQIQKLPICGVREVYRLLSGARRTRHIPYGMEGD